MRLRFCGGHGWPAVAVAGAALSLGLTACGAGGSTGSAQGAGYNAGIAGVVNASSAKGGTLTLDNALDFDSADPGNTYYGWSLNLARLWSRTLVTFKSAPGQAGYQLAPDLATNTGQVSPDGLTWTYNLKPGLKLEDGETITSQMIKYAIERTNSYGTPLSNGPVYYGQFLADPSYPGAYKDKTPGKMGLSGISTPSPTEIQFHLSTPMSEFPDILAFSEEDAPVPPAKDTGVNYAKHPLSSGPYKFASYTLGKQLVLVPNPQWNAASDPNRKQLASKIIVNLNMNPDDVDNRLLAGDANIDAQGAGVLAAAEAKILKSSDLRADSDDPVQNRSWYAALNQQVPPMNNLHCRQAVEYATNHTNELNAYGGAVGGQVAPNMMPSVIPGAAKDSYDPYEFLSKPNGDINKAKQELQQCGHPNGFSTNISYRTDKPRDTAAAQALQASLAQVGIKTDLQGYTSGQGAANSGTPDVAKRNGWGIQVYGWGADWSSGFGFMWAIADGKAIAKSGNSNLSMLNDPQLNALFDQALKTTDVSARNAIYTQIDKRVTDDAAFVPFIWSKALLYRNPATTNVYFQPQLAQYNYAVLGVKK
jgi:peptide/nickel transport system substrate-binding protein